MYKILETFEGALQGCYHRRFEVGEITDIPCADLVAVALEKGWIEPADDVPDAGPDTRLTLIVLEPRALPEYKTGWVGDLPLPGSLVQVDADKAEKLIQKGVVATVLPEDWQRYVATEDIDWPDDGLLVAAGESFAMPELDAAPWVDDGLLTLVFKPEPEKPKAKKPKTKKETPKDGSV